MDPIKLLKILFSGIPAKDHIVSVNGARKGPVTSADARMDGTNIVLEYAYDADGTKQKIAGVMHLKDAGRPGGDDEIKFNGKAVTSDDIVVSSRIVTSGFVVVIEFKFEDGGVPMRVRVDAKKAWL
jgi:hypothetical protein